MSDGSVNFDRAVEFYDASRGFPPGEDVNAARFVAEVSDLAPDARVLEIGIGTGRVALPLSRHVGDYYGVDISAGMLGKLHEKQTDERVYVAQGSALDLPFASAAFDAVVIVHVLHLVSDPRRVTDEVRRVLAPDGVALRCRNGYGEGMNMLRDAWMDATSPDRDRWQTVEDTMTESGWIRIASPQSYQYTIHTRPQDFLDRVEGRQWSSTWDMPDEMWQAGVSAVKTAIDTHYGGDSQTSVEQTGYFDVEIFRP